MMVIELLQLVNFRAENVMNAEAQQCGRDIGQCERSYVTGHY